MVSDRDCDARFGWRAVGSHCLLEEKLNDLSWLASGTNTFQALPDVASPSATYPRYIGGNGRCSRTCLGAVLLSLKGLVLSVYEGSERLV